MLFPGQNVKTQYIGVLHKISYKIVRVDDFFNIPSVSYFVDKPVNVSHQLVATNRVYQVKVSSEKQIQVVCCFQKK